MPHQIEGSTILVTGGAGLIGSTIVDQLLDAGVGEVRVLDNLIRGRMANLANATRHKAFRFVEGDVRDRAMVAQAVDGCDYVFHQAALRITLCAEKPRECLDVLAGGTLNIFEACSSAKVRKVVYASSASVYGAAKSFPTPESHHPYGNRTLYGAAKLFNEGIANHYWDMNSLPGVGLRYFNVYGPRMDLTGAYTEVFIRWLDCAEQGKPPQMHGNGSATMDFVYVGDVARANLAALRSEQNNAVYNVASGTETSLLQLWYAIQRVTGRTDLTPEFHPPRNVNPVPRRLADTSRARSELSFVADTSLDTGLRELARWRSAARQSML